jgi:hypothetical protein
MQTGESEEVLVRDREVPTGKRQAGNWKPACSSTVLNKRKGYLVSIFTWLLKNFKGRIKNKGIL